MSGSDEVKNLKPGMLCKLPRRIVGRKFASRGWFFLNRNEIYMYIGSLQASRGKGLGESLVCYYFFLDGNGERIVIDHSKGIAEFAEQHVEIVGITENG